MLGGDRPARHEHATSRPGGASPGRRPKLPREAPARITRLDNVQLVAHTGLVKDERSIAARCSPKGNSGGIQVQAGPAELPMCVRAATGHEAACSRCSRGRQPRGNERGERQAKPSGRAHRPCRRGGGRFETPLSFSARVVALIVGAVRCRPTL